MKNISNTNKQVSIINRKKDYQSKNVLALTSLGQAAENYTVL